MPTKQPWIRASDRSLVLARVVRIVCHFVGKGNLWLSTAGTHCLFPDLLRLAPSRQSFVERTIVEGKHLSGLEPVFLKLTIVKNEHRSVLVPYPLLDVRMAPQLRSKRIP